MEPKKQQLHQHQIHIKNSSEHYNKLKNLQSFISGGIAGICSKTMIAPIQRIKYLYLTRSTPFTYQSAFNDFVFIFKTHGILNFWRGNLMNVLRVFPQAAIDFCIFDFMRTTIYKNAKQKSQNLKENDQDALRLDINRHIILFFCGAISGSVAMTTVMPLQLLRIRMMMQKQGFSYHGYKHAVRQIFKSQGFFKGFYNGYTASLIGVFIYHGLSYFLFTKLKEELKKRRPEQYSKWYVDFMVGGISSFGQFIAYPFQIIKKRMQGQNLLLQRGEIQQTVGYNKLINNMIEQGARKSFFKGITVNFFKAPLASATIWTVKNYFNRLLDKTYDL